jgi:hypothetical protein
MAQNQSTIPSAPESETLTICTPSRTSDDTTKDLKNSDDTLSSIPWPGRTYIIRSQANEQVITFLNGEVILDKPGSLGTFRWRCVERNGWLGFQDPASAMYLGYDDKQWLQCTAKKHDDWEYVCARQRPDGGYVLLVLVQWSLTPLGVYENEKEGGMEFRVKIADWKADGIAWDFVEVVE